MAVLVGILNVTPDSFSDGGLYIDPAAALQHADQLFLDGASILDVGAESTRPRATPLTPEEEWQRLEPVLKTLIPRYPGKVSVDSYHPETICRALEIGPVIVNDITGLVNPKMQELVLRYSSPCIIGYIASGDIQKAHATEPTKTVDEIKKHLLLKEAELVSKGLDPNSIILDPCIGFGKTPELNRILLTFAEFVPGKKVMIGYSRKRFLGEQRMELGPNVEAGKTAIQSGATYLRVHDVKGHKSLIGK